MWSEPWHPALDVFPPTLAQFFGPDHKVSLCAAGMVLYVNRPSLAGGGMGTCGYLFCATSSPRSFR